MSDDARRPRESVWLLFKAAVERLAASKYPEHPAPTFSGEEKVVKTSIVVTFLDVPQTFYLRDDKRYRSIADSYYGRRGAFNENKAGAKTILSDYDTDFDYPAIAERVLAGAVGLVGEVRRRKAYDRAEAHAARVVTAVTGTKPDYRSADVKDCDGVEVYYNVAHDAAKIRFDIRGVTENELRGLVAALRKMRGVEAA